MLNNTEFKTQTESACAVEKTAPKSHASKVAERRLHREFRQHRSAGLGSSGWRVTLW